MTTSYTISRENQAHLYQQVSDLIREKISSGELKPGDSLSPQRELSKVCEVSMITVRRAIRDLVDEGVLVSRRGSGTYVSEAGRDSVKRGRGPAAPATTPQIALTYTHLPDGYPFLTEIIRGVQQAMGTDHVLQILEMPFRTYSEPDDKAIAQWIRFDPWPQRNLKGVLMLTPMNVAAAALCQSKRLPYVLLYNDSSDSLSHSVFIDYTAGLLQAVDHLYRTGRRRIGLITAHARHPYSGRVIAGFRMALNHFGLDSAESRIERVGFEEYHGYEAGLRLLRGDATIDAVICASDMQAKGVLMAAGEMGLTVPKQLAVIGTGNVLSPKETALEITTIDMHLPQLGARAMAMLERVIQRETDVPYYDILVPELRIRETT